MATTIQADRTNEVVRNFVSNLRSKRFTQCVGSLGQIAADGSMRFCAMGVFYETAADMGLIEHAEISASGRSIGYSPEAGHTMRKVAPRFDAMVNRPTELEAYYPYPKAGIVELNDSLNFSFDKIADAVEETYLPEDIEARRQDEAIVTDMHRMQSELLTV